LNERIGGITVASKQSSRPEQEIIMKAKKSLAAIVFLSLLLALGIGAGCSKGRSDAQVIGEVATKIQADQNVPTKQIAVQAANGVVTLSGNVNSDAERAAAANDAAQVEGVKTVINNLTVASASLPATTIPEPAPVAEQPPAEPVKPARKTSARHVNRNVNPGDRGARDTVTQVAPPASDNMAQSAPPQASTPPPPPKPTTVTIPDGTQISIRLIDPLDSEKSQIGDRFRATLSHSIVIGDTLAIPSGTEVAGRVTDVKDAGHFSGKSVLAAELTNLTMGGKNYELHTEEFRREGTARGKNTAEKVGGGAALGAIIGAIAGGGKGAAIGATVGAGAGGGVQAATKGQQIRLPSETVLNFKTIGSLTVTPGKRNSDRQQLSDNEESSNRDQ
jgi:hypothetical protein